MKIPHIWITTFALLTASAQSLPAATSKPLAQAAGNGAIAQFEGVNDHGLFTASDIASIGVQNANGEEPSDGLPFISANQEPLIISTGPLSAKAHQNINEDMRIMSRLLSDAAGTPKSTPWASGIPLLNYAKETTHRDLFIAGTGALFFINVDFPLAGRSQTETPVEKGPKDTAWERARQKVFGNNASNYASPDTLLYQYNLNQFRRPKAYRQEQVDILKEKLAVALGSATNIRSLKPTETVWVVVTGPAVLYQPSFSGFSNGAASPNQTGTQIPGIAIQQRFNDQGWQTYVRRAGQGQQAKDTRLTIAATKQDIDDFDDGVITLKEFMSRMEHHTR